MIKSAALSRQWRLVFLAAVAACHVLPAAVALGGQALEDTFARQHLHGGVVAWQANDTWQIHDGRLANLSKAPGQWLHEVASFYAPKPLGTGCIVRVDIVHQQWTRAPGYMALRLADRETGAYVEWISHVNSTDMAYRTSDAQPEMTALPGNCSWTAGHNAAIAFQWQGIDARTGKGIVRLLFGAKGGDQPMLAPVATASVKGLRSPDLCALVVNARDHHVVAPLVAFDNFYVELSDGPNAPVGFRATASSRHVAVTWRDTPGADAYVLQRAAAPAAAWQDHARLPAHSVQYIDRQARPSRLYRYRLRAESPKGHSLWTPVVETVVPGPPLPPANAAARVRTSGLVCLQWQDHAVNEHRFIVERQTEGSQTWQVWKTAAANSGSVVDILPPKVSARYRVCAVNEHGPSAWSNVAAATRPDPPPSLVSPVGTAIVSAREKLPVASVTLAFDQPVRSKGQLSPADFTIAAVKHPWHKVALPSPKITAVAWDAKTRSAKVTFAPPIPDLVEYRIGLRESIRNEAGVPVAAAPVRVAVLLGDDDRDGFVAPAAGQRLGRRLAMPPMPIGIMAEDIEWEEDKGTNNVHQIIKLMDGYKGIDFFRINVWWALLEPAEGKFDKTYVGFLRRVLAEAEKRQLPIEIGIRQEQWPLWACNHKGFSSKLYQPAAVAKFARTWMRLAKICHEYPVVFAYWPISEEYPAKSDVKNYLGCLRAVTQALRAAHPGCVVKARPFTTPMQGGHELTPIVSQQGPQDICMACGFYPTGASWTIRNPSPIAPASFNNMQVFRYYSSWVQGGANGLGEIGFRVPQGAAFGDEERLLAFQRTMALAYDIGLLEFVIWGEAWTFDNPARYLPLLVAFRDRLVRRPRAPAGQFDLRLVNDGNFDFAHAPYKRTPEPDLSHAFRWLEERGWRFYLTTPAAMAHQKVKPKASLALSELADRPAAEQTARLHKALAGVEPTGVALPWGPAPGHRQSITGMPCEIEIEFPGAERLCDAVSLGGGRVQVYAPEATAIRWRTPGAGGKWHVLTMPPTSRLMVLKTATD